VQLGLRLSEQRLDLAATLEVVPPRLGQRNAPGGTMKQPRAELILQRR
jgi:hypothetical protein